MRNIIFSLTAVTAVTLCAPALAQDQQCTNQSVDAVKAKYQPQFNQLSQDGDNIKHDATLSGHIGWKNQEFIFDTPTATMKTQTIIIGVPQVTMNIQHIIFDTPSTKMVPHKVGQYPEWHGPFKVEWHDIITNIPEFFMERQDIETKIPEFIWANTTIKFDLPEFSMQRQRVVLGLPQFTITEIHLNEHKIEQQSEALKDKAVVLQREQGIDMVDAIHSVFTCHRQELVSQQTQALQQFDGGIKSLQGTIDDISSRGVDVTKVTDEHGGTANLRLVLADLVSKRAVADTSFRDALSQLDQSEKDAVTKLAATA